MHASASPSPAFASRRRPVPCRNRNVKVQDLTPLPQTAQLPFLGSAVVWSGCCPRAPREPSGTGSASPRGPAGTPPLPPAPSSDRSSGSPDPPGTRAGASPAPERSAPNAGATRTTRWTLRASVGPSPPPLARPRASSAIRAVRSGSSSSLQRRLRTGGPSRANSVGSVVLARSAPATPSSFARYGPRTGPRLADSSACGSICFAITSLPTESVRLRCSEGTPSDPVSFCSRKESPFGHLRTRVRVCLAPCAGLGCSPKP